MKTSAFIILLFSCFTLISCDIESSGTGGLYANWQLRQIYWGFQSDVLQLRHISNNNRTLFLRYQHSNDTLTVSNPIIAENKDEMQEVTSEDILHPFGITSLTDTFTIQQLTSSTLTISNRYYRLRFRKY